MTDYTGSAGDLHHQGHDDRRDAYSAEALATTDSSLSGAERPDPRVLSGGPTAKLHRLTIAMIRVLLGLDTPKPSTMRALIARGLYVVADQQGGAVISPEGVKVVDHMVTEYDLATGQEEETPEADEAPAVVDCGAAGPYGPCTLISGHDTEHANFDLTGEPYMWSDEPLRQTERTLLRPSLGTVGASESGSRDSAGAEHLARAVDLGPELPPDPDQDPAISGIWKILHGRQTVDGREIIRGMIVNTPVIGNVTVGKVQVWSETVHVQGKDDAGRPVELSLPSNHRITLVDAPEQLSLMSV